MLLFPESGPKKDFRVTVSLKTATPESGSKKDFRETVTRIPGSLFSLKP
jgi:hypothetical protein